MPEPEPAPASAPTAAPSALPAPPEQCDVLVVGAGPAGSACAQWLARAGWRVVLVEQQVFPRDKICGDGLIPDAHHALQRLGVQAEVMAQAQSVAHVACIGPRGGRVDVPGRLAVLPRKQLDDILKRAAERAGAQFFAPWRFEAPVLEGDLVVGAHLSCQAEPGKTGDQPRLATVHARWVVLATGAIPKALQAAQVCLRQQPTGVALRGYIHHPAMADQIRAMEVVWHKRLSKGYGWIFPCRDGLFNIGVGLAHSHRALANSDGRSRGQMQDVNLREMFKAFTEVHAPAAALLAGGHWQSPLKGAPLRCSLDGALFGRPGLLVTGEAAGSTYAFTGEGIGKAMETGLMAAESLLAGQAASEPEAATRARYEARVMALKPRFDLYERANRVNEHPWLADLVIWRARNSPRILRRMAGVLEETDNPGRLVSVRGITKLFLPIR